MIWQLENDVLRLKVAWGAIGREIALSDVPATLRFKTRNFPFARRVVVVDHQGEAQRITLSTDEYREFASTLSHALLQADIELHFRFKPVLRLRLRPV